MPAFTLSKKIFITFFLIAMGTAFFFSCLNSYDRTHFSLKQTVHHYKGSEENHGDGEEFSYPMLYKEVIEVMHVHAFMIPLIIFVMSRILSMARAGEGIKITIYVSAFIGTIMNLSAPYLIIYASEIFTISLIASYIILGPCFIVFMTLPICKMWSMKPAEESDYWL
ncbi:MAG: hypothetical protein NUV86_08665 [Candidatus Scalindua sp.]|nr:hypothetical protein [Candidatus Scalindua sp.]MCR4343783.1 hypothetical protein [Candidatus Scalindua sp.]